MLGGMLRILVVGLLIMVVALMLVGRQKRMAAGPTLATVLPEARSLPVTNFTDASGQPFTTADLAGNHTLLFFGFTNCPDICPLTLQVLALVKDEIERREPAAVPRVAFVSVDPERDSPAAVRRYLDAFDADFVGLTAPENAMTPLWEALGVSVHRQQIDGATYNVVHNGTIYLLDEQGRWIALFSGTGHDPAAVAADYLRIAGRAARARTARTDGARRTAGLGGPGAFGGLGGA
jgi:protein SCO1/2